MKISNRIFKFGFTLIVMCASLLSGPFLPPSHVAKAASDIIVGVRIKPGRPKHHCEGFGICLVAPIITTSKSIISAGSVEGELSVTGDGKLQLRFLSKAPNEGPIMSIDDDFPLSQDLAKKLGLKSATILKGEYPFSASKALFNARLTK